MAPEPQPAPAPTPLERNGDGEEMAERMRRLEDQLAALRAQQAAAARPTALATTNPFAGVTGLVLPMLQRFGGSGPIPEPGMRLGFFTEFRLMARMYVDPHYRVSRIAQFGVPAVLIVMVLNSLFWPDLFILTAILRQLTLMVLSIALYKLLSREAARYAEVLAYLTRHGRGAR